LLATILFAFVPPVTRETDRRLSHTDGTLLRFPRRSHSATQNNRMMKALLDPAKTPIPPFTLNPLLEKAWGRREFKPSISISTLN
jgi:hypothetical protein